MNMRNRLPPRETPLNVDDIVPDFVLPDQDRREWRLSDAVRQGDVVLAFVPFAFTGVCSTEMKCISADFDKWSGKGAAVVAVNCDSPFVNKKWSEIEGYRHRILSDLHRDVVRALGLYWEDMNVARRATVVIARSPDGVAKIRSIDVREPSKAMNWENVLAQL
jgi:peroxiredoxin